MRFASKSTGGPGFTLVELLVVLVLIAVLTGVMATQMSGSHEDALLRSTSRKVIDVVNLASSQSAAMKVEHRLQLDAISNRFAVSAYVQRADASTGASASKTLVLEEGPLDSRITLQVRDSLTAEGAMEPSDRMHPADRGLITFYPDGTADSREVVLRDRRGGEILLRINPITSRVRILAKEERSRE